jgi:hypothetical protein
MNTHIQLDGVQIHHTAERLTRRIGERFPDSGLREVSVSIEKTCLNAQLRIDALHRPIWSIRILALGIGVFSLSLILYMAFGGIRWTEFHLPQTYVGFLGVLEPTLGSLVFLTGFFVFVVTLEKRWKQHRVLTALNELRALAHVIDMHQLTKDPERYLLEGKDTKSSPERTLTPFELGRYLDYCSEMLAFLSKVAALWAQAFPETNTLAAVDQIETLTSGLSRKIWQKLMMLEHIVRAHKE